MSKGQMLRCLVKQRLTEAAEEIFGLFERTIAEYEEEASRLKEDNERLKKRLHAVFNPEVRIQRADLQQLFVRKEHWEDSEHLCNKEEQKEPEPPQIKEEEEDPEPHQIKEEQKELEPPQIKEEKEDPKPPQMKEEQLQGLVENEMTFSFTSVKRDVDEDEAQFFQLHQRRTEHMEKDGDGEDCGGPEPDRNPGTYSPQEPDAEKTGDSFETEDRDDRNETRKAQSGLNSHNGEDFVSDLRCGTSKKPLTCSECKKTFRCIKDLKKHIMTHTLEKPFSCSQCGTQCQRLCSLRDVVVAQLEHLDIQTGNQTHGHAGNLEYTHTVELSEPGEAPEHPKANRHQLDVAEVQPLYVVQMLRSTSPTSDHTPPPLKGDGLQIPHERGVGGSTGRGTGTV
ncbi:uncharacterized protein AB9W97_022281 [Spinachia spinachia]